MKIICIGRNYKNHAKELGNEIPSKPVLFLKPDTSILKGKDFYIPEFSNEIHHEIEIVVKISKGGKYIQKKNAHSHYNEITIGLDFTARDLQNELKSKGLPWEISKGFDGSSVVGNFYSKENFDLSNVNFSLLKNTEKIQNGNSSQMIFSIEDIISYASQYFTLRTGDLIFTGTPEGVGKINENDILDGYLENAHVFSIRAY